MREKIIAFIIFLGNTFFKNMLDKDSQIFFWLYSWKWGLKCGQSKCIRDTDLALMTHVFPGKQTMAT